MRCSLSGFGLRRPFIALALGAAFISGSVRAEEPQTPPTPPPQTASAPPAADTQPKAEPQQPAPLSQDGKNLRFDFRDVPLDTVLDYLSEAGGFTVVREATPDGRVDIVSRQPLNKDEAVALLNTVLNGKGYAAIREGRTLTIVKSEDAKQKDIPVKSGADPDAIQKSGEMVTQVIPVRHADATQLLENLKPLLPSYAVSNANQSSNAIVLTATQTDVRRMAEIVQALDTSISEISEVRVFQLTHANATETAAMINALFQTPMAQGGQAAGAAGQRGGGSGPGQNLRRMAAAAGLVPAEKPSAAMLAAARVVAIADERTASVVVSATAETMAMIAKIDKEGIPTADIRVFPLEYADAAEMAQVINDAFSQAALGGAAAARPAAARPQATRPGSTGNLAHAVPDYRTNAVVVTADPEAMDQVAKMIEKLDSNPAREQKVYVYKLKNADVAEVAAVLQGMFAQSGTTANRPRTTATTSSRSATSNSSTRRNTGSSNATRRSSSGTR